MGFTLGSQTKTEDGATITLATTSSDGGNKVTIASGKNFIITGTDVISDNGTDIQAAGGVTLDAAFNQSRNSQSTATTTVTAAGTTVGAVDGNITITISAGGTFTQAGQSLICIREPALCS